MESCGKLREGFFRAIQNLAARARKNAQNWLKPRSSIIFYKRRLCLHYNPGNRHNVCAANWKLHDFLISQSVISYTDDTKHWLIVLNQIYNRNTPVFRAF